MYKGKINANKSLWVGTAAKNGSQATRGERRFELGEAVEPAEVTGQRLQRGDLAHLGDW